jgi:hypothetical protein
MLLSLFLDGSVFFIIVKFSNFTLTTKTFKIQSIATIVASGICVVLYFAWPPIGNWIMAAFPGAAFLASVAICVRVCLLRKRVQRGEIGEMKRGNGGKAVDVENCGAVELEDGNKFRVVNSEEVVHSAKVTVGSGEETAKPRPSFNSVGTGASGAPQKFVKELV